MKISRRDALALGGAGVIAISIFPVSSAFALTKEAQAFVDEFTGGAEVIEGGVTISAPELAENGGSVPITVMADGAKSIMVIAEANPYPKIVTFEFGELSGSSEVSTKIRMAASQELLAIAKMADGSFKSGKVAVEVTAGGC
jgi:sulfur-oxidizing protein SoxY